MATAHDFYRDAPNEPADLVASLAADLADHYRSSPALLSEAEQWAAGTLGGEHYAEVALALDRLHNTSPEFLLGSDLLTQLYRLARVQADAINAQLLSMAEAELQRQADEAEEARSEALSARARSADWFADRLQRVRP